MAWAGRLYVIVALESVVIVDENAGEARLTQAVGPRPRHRCVGNDCIPGEQVRAPAGIDHEQPALLLEGAVGGVSAAFVVNCSGLSLLGQVVCERYLGNVVPGADHRSRQSEESHLCADARIGLDYRVVIEEYIAQHQGMLRHSRGLCNRNRRRTRTAGKVGPKGSLSKNNPKESHQIYGFNQFSIEIHRFGIVSFRWVSRYSSTLLHRLCTLIQRCCRLMPK